MVTGATGGVGALYATGLAERGYDLLLAGRQQKTLDAPTLRFVAACESSRPRVTTAASR